ncbi:MAG: hypothetical protein WC882_04455, partial [Candidatus Gracilibacteria bacterium]
MGAGGTGSLRIVTTAAILSKRGEVLVKDSGSKEVEEALVNRDEGAATGAGGVGLGAGCVGAGAGGVGLGAGCVGAGAGGVGLGAG